MPALLARSPTANIKELGLERHQIMPCEPLRDLKGVLSNTCTELERHLPAPAADSYKEVIGVTVGRQHSRGCDWREAVCLLAKQATTWESCPQKAKHLLRNLALSRLQVRHFKELAPSASDTPEQLPLDVELHSILKPTDW